MTAGKQMAQTGHADNDLYGDLLSKIAEPEKAWGDEGLLAVRDAGFTEIAPGTVTVIARAPVG